MNIVQSYSCIFDWQSLKLFRHSKKRHYSSSRHSPGSLEAVSEEHFCQSPNFELARPSEDVLAPETGIKLGQEQFR